MPSDNAVVFKRKLSDALIRSLTEPGKHADGEVPGCSTGSRKNVCSGRVTTNWPAALNQWPHSPASRNACGLTFQTNANFPYRHLTEFLINRKIPAR